MLISEIYCSRQGEGILTGTQSVFVRTSGCNLRCGFCDTPFASWSPQGDFMQIEEIVHRIHESAGGAKHVVITGGEPMIAKDLAGLCKKIRSCGFHITIETAGTVVQEVDCQLMSISPKFGNSDPTLARAGEWRQRHVATRYQPQVVTQLIRDYDFQLKFVLDVPEDIDEILDYLDVLGQPVGDRVLLMPQGVDQDALEKRRRWLEPLCEKRGFVFCPRMHIEWYGNRRGT
ncbi:7-carboxy-7-deazaguanine synthase QueE [Mariniblastus sp.]|nr:7-carboxy-7-deazaguanine synthase QueE [Mariniblastus sp.]